MLSRHRPRRSDVTMAGQLFHTHRVSAFASLGSLALAAIFAVPTSAAAQAPAARAPQGQVTFAKDVLPILQKRCQDCHRPGSIAPMSLLTYQDVRPWVRAIKTRTENREMPP